MKRSTWRKSSYSSPQGGNCVEVAAVWHKSSYSANEVQCVEVGDLGNGRAVRDSKNPAGPALTFPAAQWAAFTAGVRAGQFD